MNPKSQTRIRLDEVLADGDWHLVDDVITTIMGTVAPGAAARHAEKLRLHCATPGHPSSTERQRGDTDTAIRVGQRALARQVLVTAVRWGPYERDGDCIRLTPTN